MNDSGNEGILEHTPKVDLTQFKFPRFSRRIQSKSEPWPTPQDEEDTEDVLTPALEAVEVEEVVRTQGSPSPSPSDNGPS